MWEADGDKTELFFIDYLVLRTGWSDEQVLRNTHRSNKRKFNTYRTMDSLSEIRPIVVIPAVGENLAMLSIDNAQSNFQEQQINFYKEIGLTRITPVIDPEIELAIKAQLEKAVGKKIYTIEELLEKRNGS